MAATSAVTVRIPLLVSDIFISYAKEDRERARVLAEALEALG